MVSVTPSMYWPCSSGLLATPLTPLRITLFFADVDAVDRGAAVLRDRRDLDVRAVLDMEPDGNIKVRFLFKDDALAGNTALDGKRHLERRGAGVQLVIDLLDRHCVGDIKFAGEGCGHRVLQISGQVRHNRFLLKLLYFIYC